MTPKANHPRTRPARLRIFLAMLINPFPAPRFGRTMEDGREEILETELLAKCRELLELKGAGHEILFEDLPDGRRLILSMGFAPFAGRTGPFRLMMLPSMPVWPSKDRGHG